MEPFLIRRDNQSHKTIKVILIPASKPKSWEQIYCRALQQSSLLLSEQKTTLVLNLWATRSWSPPQYWSIKLLMPVTPKLKSSTLALLEFANVHSAPWHWSQFHRSRLHRFEKPNSSKWLLPSERNKLIDLTAYFNWHKCGPCLHKKTGHI